MTRAASKIVDRPRRESRTTGSTGTGRKIATVERRKASVSILLETRGAQTRRLRAGHGTRYRVSRSTRSACGAHHPLDGGGNVETKPIRREAPGGRRKDEGGDRETNRRL